MNLILERHHSTLILMVVLWYVWVSLGAPHVGLLLSDFRSFIANYESLAYFIPTSSVFPALLPI